MSRKLDVLVNYNNNNNNYNNNNNNKNKNNNNNFIIEGKRVTVWTLTNLRPSSRTNWNLKVLVLVEGGKPENPEKNPRSKARTKNKLNPHETLSTEIKPESQRWDWGDPLSTELPVLPKMQQKPEKNAEELSRHAKFHI